MPSYQPVSFQSPGFDYGADLSQIERRRAMAQMLQQQGMQDIPQQPTGAGQFAVPISPFQGAAKLGQILAASRQQSKADQQQRQLAQTSQSNLASVLMNAQKAAAGTPGSALSEDASGNVTPAQAAVPGDMGKAASLYMSHPQTMQLGAGMMQENIQDQRRQKMLSDLIGNARDQGATAGGPWSQQYGAQQAAQGNPMAGMDPRLLSMAMDKDAGMSKLGMHMLGRGETSGRVFYDQNNRAYTVMKDGTPKYLPGVEQGISPADRLKIPLQQAQTYWETGQRPGPLGAPAAPNAPMAQAPQAAAPSLETPQTAPSPLSPLNVPPKEKARLEAERPQQTLAATTNLNNLHNSMTEIDRLMSQPGLANITGPVAGRTPNLTGAATNAQANLDTLKSQIGVHTLQAMRDASKTGGAVGQVTEKEWPILQNQLGALQQAQTTAEFRKNLGYVKETMQRVQDNVKKSYEMTYGKLDWKPPTAHTEPLTERERAELESLRARHGRR